MAKRGRPSLYKPEYCEQARKLCLLGATDKDLAGFFEVDEATINRWKAGHPDFCESLKAGKDEADSKVVRSLYERATGYSHPEDKIFQYEGEPVIVPTVKHYPPDTTAAIFWLKNRQKADWRDRTEHEIGAPGAFNELSDAERDQEIARYLGRGGPPKVRPTTH